MIRDPRPQGKAEDIRSVCKMVHTLLRLGDATGVRGTMGILAEDFIGVPPTATVEDLLQVRPIKYDIYFYLTLISTRSFRSAQPHGASVLSTSSAQLLENGNDL
jgi:hypothetical protein